MAALVERVARDNGPDGIRLNLAGDTHCFAPADIEALARTMEAAGVEAAFDPAAPTRVRDGAP